MSVGNKIVNMRSERNLSQRQFAEMLGTTVSVLSNWENGRNNPNKVMLARLSKMADVKVSDFVEKDTKVGYRIRIIRKEKGMTMEEFGKLVGDAKKSAVGNWERGDNFPNNERLKRIAEIGGISVEELLYGRKTKSTTNNIKITPIGNKYTIVIKEGNQDRWLTVDEDTARELISKLGSVLNG